MITNFFHLQIIPIADIFPHEKYDQRRTRPLIAQLKAEKHLINPIIVTTFENDKYLQLDGMNRFCAFKSMGLLWIVAQIIDYTDQEDVELSSWVHLFSGSKEKLSRHVNQTKGLSIFEEDLKDVGHRYIKEKGEGWLCTLVSKKGKALIVSSNGGFLQKVDLLNQLVSFWERGITRDLLPPHATKDNLQLIFDEHPDKSFMAIFPTFTRHQIVEVVRQGHHFPPGITRHIIKRRCLNINIPLTFFSTKKSIDEQNMELAKYLKKQSYRVYEESTIYFE